MTNSPTSQARSRERLDRAVARFLGIALLVAACDPAGHTGGELLVPLAAAGFAWWAAPPTTARPAVGRRTNGLAGLGDRLARHRNTVVATAAVLLAAVNHPPAWLAAGITALLLGYLLLVDARGVGHRPAGPLPALAACGAAALVLLAALAPTGASSWARPGAALGVAVAALGVGITLWTRRPEAPRERRKPAGPS
ncbi:hypothetical protein ACIGXM_19545 [Kitasatospora sp. NPDC052896]|uniref:hypothetical protein n=1 Tax=Kitasatospora sp. NPDC052896 TaxID=3364061 RepID=UPI0037CBBE1A